MIDTNVEGSPASVRTAATYLGETLKTAVDDAGDDAQLARSKALSSWDGDASESYRGFARKLVTAADHQVTHLRGAREKFDAYAGKLERTQTRMSRRRTEATTAGLVVNDKVIERPADAVSPGTLPPDPTATQSRQHQQASDAYTDQLAKIKVYNRLLEEVGQDHESLAQWVRDHLDTFWAEVDGPTALDVLVDALKKLPSAVTGFAFDYKSRQMRERADDATKESKRLTDENRDARAARRSGNPARRAAGEAVDIPGNRTTARGLDAVAEGATTLAKRLPIVGTVATLGFAGGEIASGESPSKVIVGEVGGLAGGALGAAAVVGGAALLGVGAPVIAVAAGAAVVGIGVGLLAEHAWENWVPDDVTEAIDEGLEDFGEGVADVAGDVGDTLTFWD